MSIATELERFIVDEIVVGEAGGIAAHDDLLANGIIDSHGLVEVVGFIEARYGITVADEDLRPENFESLASIDAYVERKRTR